MVISLLINFEGGILMPSIVYERSDSMTVQGKQDEVFRKYGKKWHISELGGGNGNWLLKKRADVLVDGISRRRFVLDYYQREKLTEKLVEKFRKDVENGVISMEQIEW